MKPNGDPQCKCEGGYSGPLCEINPTGIEFRPTFYHIVIMSNRYGNNYQYVLLDCRNTPCLNNGHCTKDSSVGNAKCDCNHGYRGSHCEIEPEARM